MTDVDKLAINNELIRLKEKIKAAKICVIRKLVRKLKDARRSSNLKPESTKFPAQIARFTSQLEYLKKVTLVRMGALVLASRKKPEECFSDPESSVESVCVAHVAAHKGIAEEMATIKQNFNLDDTSNWQDVVVQIAAGAGKKGKDKKQKRPMKKSGKEGGHNQVNKEKTKVKREQKSPKNNKKNTNETSKPPKDKQTANAPKPNKKTKNAKTKEETSTENGNPEAQNQVTVDPFFITDDGSNYLSTAVINRTEDPVSDDEFSNRRDRRSNQFGRNKSFNKTTQSQTLAKRKPNPNSDFYNKKPKFDDEANVENAANLHPSWAAKKKQKPTITDFKGTKITFD